MNTYPATPARPVRGPQHHGLSHQRRPLGGRRTLMMLLAAVLLAVAGSATAQEQLDVLRVRHPANLAFAAPFQFIADSGALSAYATEVDIAPWTTPDILRSILVNNQSEVTAVPTYEGANLANRGVDVKMAAVVVWGILWAIGPDGADGWDALRGQTIMVPYRNDMPDLVFTRLAQANGLTPGVDFEVQYFATPQEVVSQLVSGRGQWAVLPEHVATVALANANNNGQSLGRYLNLQAEWATVTGKARIPQAGIVVPTWLADERPDLLGAILTALEDAVALVNAAEPDTVAALAEANGLPAGVVQGVIPRLNLEILPAGAVQEELEAFYSELAKLSPDIIGGQLPSADFYLPDPR